MSQKEASGYHKVVWGLLAALAYTSGGPHTMGGIDGEFVKDTAIPLDEIAHYIRNMELEYDVVCSITLMPSRGSTGGVVWNVTMVALSGRSWPVATLIEPYRKHWPNGRHKSMTAVFYAGVLELDRALEAHKHTRDLALACDAPTSQV